MASPITAHVPPRPSFSRCIAILCLVEPHQVINKALPDGFFLADLNNGIGKTAFLIFLP